MIKRDWTEADVKRLRGPYKVEHSVAKWGAEKLRRLINAEGTRALGASTPAQAVQMVQAGLKSIYVSGWQVAADVNGDMYPDQSLYPCDRVPKLVKSINNALLRQSQIDSSEGDYRVADWLVPLVADCEAGFGGVLNAYELTKKMIEAGAAAVHFEDQLSSEKKCGHLGGKVLVPTQEMVNKLKAARLAADVCDTNTVIIARTDANSARLATKFNPDEVLFYSKTYDAVNNWETTPDGFFRISGGIEQAIQRGLAYAPYADMIWCETSTPSIEEAKQFADAIHAKYPDKLLAYNCSPSFNWSKNLSKDEIATFQYQLMKMGYKFQFVTLAGFHSLNEAMFCLAKDYSERDMSAFSELQDDAFARQVVGYDAVRHQRFVGTGYFDSVRNTIAGESSTGAMKESTETAQF